MHGKNVNGINLQVQLARRQPQIEPINDASSSAVWSSIGGLSFIYFNICLTYFSFMKSFFLAASKSQKGSHKDRREMVQYDEDFLL